MNQRPIRERMATPARQLDASDARSEVARLDDIGAWMLPADRLRYDALHLRLRELAGEAVTWPMLADCGRCGGTGVETTGIGRWASTGICLGCEGRGKLAIELTDQAELRLVPVAARAGAR